MGVIRCMVGPSALARERVIWQVLQNRLPQLPRKRGGERGGVACGAKEERGDDMYKRRREDACRLVAAQGEGARA